MSSLTPKAVSLLDGDVDREVVQKLGECAGALAEAASAVQLAIARKAEIGSAADEVAVLTPASIAAVRLTPEGLLP